MLLWLAIPLLVSTDVHAQLDWWVVSENTAISRSGQDVILGFSVTLNTQPMSGTEFAFTPAPLLPGTGNLYTSQFYVYQGTGAMIPTDPTGNAEYNLGALPDGTYGVLLEGMNWDSYPVYRSYSEFVINDSATSFTTFMAESSVAEELRGEDDDPDMDGAPCLVEYLFGTNPDDSTSKPTVTTARINISGHEYSAVLLPGYSPNAKDVAITVEYSQDGITWKSEATFKVPYEGKDAYIVNLPSFICRVRVTSL